MAYFMGKSRLEKILFKYISNRPDLVNKLSCDIKEYGKDMVFTYRRNSSGGGNEWLKCSVSEYSFEIYASGLPGKIVVINEWFYNEELDKDIYIDRILTRYDKLFNPLPDLTWLSGAVAGVTARKQGYYPFKDGNVLYNGLCKDRFVCYDIAKKEKTI